MSLTVIGMAWAGFAALFALQVLIARIYRPESEDKFIIGYYVICPLILICGITFWRWSTGLPTNEILASYLLYIVISGSWVASYPAIYAVCPSLIVSYVIDRSPQGVTLEEMRALLTLKQNSKERLNDAVHDKWVRKNGDKIELTLIGKTFLLFFSSYRRIIGLQLDTL